VSSMIDRSMGRRYNFEMRKKYVQDASGSADSDVRFRPLASVSEQNYFRSNFSIVKIAKLNSQMKNDDGTLL
jgi:hypothetical protein